MNPRRFKLLFFGSDSFSVKVLEHLVDQKLCHIQVVTGPYSPLDRYSTGKGLPRHRWPLNLPNSSQDSFNIGLVASFGHLIDPKTVGRFSYGLFNVHPSLLPQYRGSTPVQAAVLDGLDETGCTLMRIPPVDKFDIGDIILQEKLKINHREYAVDLAHRLAHLGARMSERLLLNYDEYINGARPQGNRSKSYAKKIKPEQGQLCFKTDTSTLIDRKFRAYYGYSNLYITCFNGLRVKLDGLLDPEDTDALQVDSLVFKLHDMKDVPIKDIPSGSMYFHKPRQVLCIKGADNRWLAFRYAFPELKPKMSALEFYNGYMSKFDLEHHSTDE